MSSEQHNLSGEVIRRNQTAESAVGFPQTDEIDRMARVASIMSKSGYFKDARDAAQAFAKLLFGRDLGLGPTQALTDIQIIEGKPQLSANLQASLLKEHPDYDYRAEHGTDGSEAYCEIIVFKNGQEVGRERFTWGDAQRAGLIERNKHTWAKYPRNMLFARAISNAVAFHCPEVTSGIRTYGPGELNGVIEEHDVPSPTGDPNAELPIEGEVISESDGGERLREIASMVGLDKAANALGTYLGFENLEAVAADPEGSQAFERVLSAAADLSNPPPPVEFVGALRSLKSAAGDETNPAALATVAVAALSGGE